MEKQQDKAQELQGKKSGTEVKTIKAYDLKRFNDLKKVLLEGNHLTEKESREMILLGTRLLNTYLGVTAPTEEELTMEGK